MRRGIVHLQFLRGLLLVQLRNLPDKRLRIILSVGVVMLVRLAPLGGENDKEAIEQRGVTSSHLSQKELKDAFVRKHTTF